MGGSTCWREVVDISRGGSLLHDANPRLARACSVSVTSIRFDFSPVCSYFGQLRARSVGRPTYSRENSSRSSKLDRFDLGQCSNIAYWSRFQQVYYIYTPSPSFSSSFLSLSLSSRVNISSSLLLLLLEFEIHIYIYIYISSRIRSNRSKFTKGGSILFFLNLLIFFFPLNLLSTKLSMRAHSALDLPGTERIEDEERGSGCEIVSKTR